MTLYKFPSGKIVSDEDYKKTFAEEYPADREEAASDYVVPSSENKQIVFDNSEEDDDD